MSAFLGKSITKMYGSTLLFRVTRRWVGVKFPGKKRYVTLEVEWPLTRGVGGCQFSIKKRYVTLEWPPKREKG